MIILCSTDEKVRERWRGFLDGLDMLSVCTTIDHVAELVTEHRDAIVLQHLKGPEADGLATVTAFIQAQPAVKVIACVDLPNDDHGLALLKAGVYGYCNTWMAASQLQLAIEQVRAGEAWVGRSLILRLIRGLAPATQSESASTGAEWLLGLTEREREVALLIGEGNSNKLIATALEITERTVKAHLSAIFRKTGCKDRIQLALLATQASPDAYSKLGS